MSIKILIGINSSWNFVNFRSGLIKSLIAHGYEVVAAAPADEYVSKLKELGCRYIKLSIDNKGTHPGRDVLLFADYFKLIRAEKPSVFLGYTIKPNIYGSLAAHSLGVPVINNVAGLGTVFNKSGWLNRLVRQLYRISLSRSAKVFFQNNEDLQLFLSGKLVAKAVADRLPGSGVDLVKFNATPLPTGPIVRFLLIARMLWDKGVGEYVEAARLLKQRGIDAECCLLGFLDVQNPAAISRKQMDEWVSEGVVSYLGMSDSVSDEISNATCVVLPSFYREGTPRTLLEAAAVGRPIVTTDAVGCRDVVDDGVNGFLCKPKDASDLADKMERIVRMSLSEREVMGENGRIKVEREFDEQIVINKYLQAIEEILAKR
jgi:glycosyltransferase involved in cell wall biosynthesis